MQSKLVPPSVLPHGAPITVLVPSRIGLDAIAPVLAELLRRGTAVHAVVPDESCEAVRIQFGGGLKSLTSMSAYLNRKRWVRWLVTLVATLRTPFDYTSSYQALTLPTRLGFTLDSKCGRLFLATVGRLPKWPRQEVDRRMHRLAARFVRANVFPTPRILVVTFFGAPHLLCAPSQEVVTFTESWDHPAKFPLGYVSHAVFVWNQHLAQDWIEFHGPTSVHLSYPMKLRYAIEGRQCCGSGDDGMIMYAATTSSNTDQIDPAIFAEELTILRAVCRATLRAGVPLLIKPKPNGRQGDFDSLSRDYSHVEIGTYGDVRDTSAYTLGTDYNITRNRELSRCAAVINVHTTFAFDAALHGLPVIQLDINDSKVLPIFTAAMARHHVRRHFLRHSELVYQITQDRSIEDVLYECFLSKDMAKAARYSEYLRAWIEPTSACVDAIQRVAEVCTRPDLHVSSAQVHEGGVFVPSA